MRNSLLRFLCIAVMLMPGAAAPALADKPKVVNTRIIWLSKNRYEFQVTVGHVDTSWDHYADRWEVIGPDGKVLGTRILHHPHIGERLFLRTLRGLNIPDGVENVLIRAHDKPHGYGREKLIQLPTADNRDTGWK